MTYIGTFMGRPLHTTDDAIVDAFKWMEKRIQTLHRHNLELKDKLAAAERRGSSEGTA